VYEKLNKQGICTSLVTGQERREMPGASHISSTLEMVSVDREFDVVVVDEIQMIADKDRGYAW
jgi:ATP-dependent RNA helicase SUPV3L1/SUV3